MTVPGYSSKGHAQGLGGAAAHSDDDLVGLCALGDRFWPPHPCHSMLQRHNPEFSAEGDVLLNTAGLAHAWLHQGLCDGRSS